MNHTAEELRNSSSRGHIWCQYNSLKAFSHRKIFGKITSALSPSFRNSGYMTDRPIAPPTTAAWRVKEQCASSWLVLEETPKLTTIADTYIKSCCVHLNLRFLGTSPLSVEECVKSLWSRSDILGNINIRKAYSWVVGVFNFNNIFTVWKVGYLVFFLGPQGIIWFWSLSFFYHWDAKTENSPETVSKDLLWAAVFRQTPGEIPLQRAVSQVAQFVGFVLASGSWSKKDQEWRDTNIWPS